MLSDQTTITREKVLSAKQELMQYGKMPKSTDEPKDLNEKVSGYWVKF